MKAIDVARLFLYKANMDGDIITNLKMQKLLYYAQAWYLVNFHKPLFDDEIEAWAYGPVIPAIYNEFKKFGYLPIKYKDNNGKEEGVFSQRDLDFLNVFYDKFIGCSAHLLANMTHNEGPWKEAYKDHAKVIDVEKIEKFYTKQFKERQS